MSVRLPNDGMAPMGAPVARRSLADVLAAGLRRLSLAPTAMDQGAPSLRVNLSKARRVVKAEPVPAPAALPDVSPKSWSEAELQKERADFENEWLGNTELRDQARASRKREEEAKHERKRELLDAYVSTLPLLGAVDYSDPEVNRKFDAWAAELGLEAYQLKQYVRKRLKQRREDAMGNAMASLLADETMDASL